jgi:hypothetical protein
MSLLSVMQANLRRSIGLYEELAAGLPEAALRERLPGLPSNTLGQQLWCVVGARESYSRAITAGEWSGFRCSLAWERCDAKRDVVKALSSSGSDILGALSGGDSFNDRQNQLMLDQLEHEAAHQGQLIRYLYALRLPIPDSWKSRYALD